jgi:hypothetical protein
MGSTAQSTNLTPSTFVAGITQGAAIAWQAVTSSGAYFNCGDLNRTIILIQNGSSSDTGAVWIEPGGVWAAGSGGQAASTTSTLYSTATAPIAISVPLHGITGSSATMSTTGSLVVIGPFDSDKIKSSDGNIFIVASTGSTEMVAAVYQMMGGSTA